MTTMNSNTNFYVLGQKTSDVQTNLLGTRAVFPAVDPTDTGDAIRSVPNGIPIEAVWVQLTGASSVAPGLIVKWTSGSAGTKVSGITGSAEVGAGMVDPYLTASVAQNECFWLIRRGYVQGVSGASYSANVELIPNNAGKLIAMTADVAGVAARCGRAVEAAGAGDLEKYVILDFQV
jgi:hypothetical protein